MIDATTIIDYDYGDFEEGIAKIAMQIYASGFKPDYIVGIVRGGAVPAVYLSHKLKIPVVMVHWNTRDAGVHDNDSDARIAADIDAGKNILLIDDIVDGGETVLEVLADWEQKTSAPIQASKVKVASLIYNSALSIPVDFYHREIDRNVDQRWVVFPWEY